MVDSLGNKGIIVSGGVLKAKQIAVGDKALVTSKDAKTLSGPGEPTSVRNSYTDFDVLFVHSKSGYVVRGRDYRSREAIVTLKLSTEEVAEARFLQESQWYGLDMNQNVPFDPDQLKEAGEKLFSAVLHGDLLSCFRANLEKTDSGCLGVRIRLHLGEVPELARFAWEWLYDPSLERFIALSTKTPVVRSLSFPVATRSLAIEKPWQILFVAPQPSDYERLRCENEWQNIKKATRAMETRGGVRLQILQRPTLKNLRQYLRRYQVNVLHFVGHGGFSETKSSGQLVFEDECGRGRLVAADQVGLALRDHSPLSLVFINTCGGARASRANSFSGIAQSLIQVGVPAVVAMQASVSDIDAVTLAAEFYGALVDGLPVDASLAEARKAVASASLHWGAPALYMRSRGAPL